jgi:hypothetical protein
MIHSRVTAALTICLLLAAATVRAQTASPQPIPFQEPGNRIGITMGYPSTFGVVWEVNDRFALRPELSFSVGTSEGTADGVAGTSSDTWTIGFGVSALIFLKQWDAVQTYIAPRFTYSRGTSTVESVFGGDNDLTSEGFSLNGLFGAQYALHRRFSVFGEVGVGFTNSETRLSSIDGKTESTSFGTRTAVGVIFFF